MLEIMTNVGKSHLYKHSQNEQCMCRQLLVSCMCRQLLAGLSNPPENIRKPLVNLLKNIFYCCPPYPWSPSTHTHTHTHTRARTHARTHTRTHARTHTHTHTHRERERERERERILTPFIFLLRALNYLNQYNMG